MLMLIIILWLAWSFRRPRYYGPFWPMNGWYRRPPMDRSRYGYPMGSFHHSPMGGFHHSPMGGMHRPPMGGFGGAFGGGGHTMGGGAGRGRR